MLFTADALSQGWSASSTWAHGAWRSKQRKLIKVPPFLVMRITCVRTNSDSGELCG